MKTINIFWFRRDLRMDDNAGLFQALKAGLPVLPLFIFDKNILDKLDNKEDRRVSFIFQVIQKLQQQLVSLGSSLQVYYGFPEQVLKKLISEYAINTIFANHDYELYSIDRDNKIAEILRAAAIQFETFKDHVIFEKNEVVKPDGKPYTVFTPYSRKWKSTLTDFQLKSYPTEKYFTNFLKQPTTEIPSLGSMEFKNVEFDIPSIDPEDELIKNYFKNRDYPAVNGTSKLGVHLRFGTISIRQLACKARLLNEIFFNELIWREFYQAILWHFPHIGRHKPFKPEYEKIEWRNNEEEFELWCNGKTGYPIVDAGMRELNSTGFMHNRVRMIVASFLTKHLLIDWRWGEAYFADNLLDYEFASNNGGWQWAAGSGCDAAPYFRIFNPYLQTKKFDPEMNYIKKWVPEFQEFSYPQPIVEHEFARKRCLEVYSRSLQKQ